MSEIIFVVEQSPEGGYAARALGESIFAQAASLHEKFPRPVGLGLCQIARESRLSAYRPGTARRAPVQLIRKTG